MPLTISDEFLKQAGLSEQDAMIEIACRLFDANKISKFSACRLTGLSRADFEGELTRRNLSWIHIDWDETYEKEFAEIAREAASKIGAEGK